jgi:hypothetical protein
MLRYALRNVLHYRSKYGIAFALIAAFAFCLALSLFAFNGFWKQAGVYARAWGDVTLWVDTVSLDKGEPAGGWPPGEAPSQRLERAWPAFFKDELKATKVVATSFIWGSAYGKGGSWSLQATSLEKAKQLMEVDLAEGKLPGEGEVIVPSSLRRSLALGDGLTFVYKNRDLILNSLTFRISGFFLPSGSTSNMLYLPQAQFDQLDETRDSVFFAFLPGMGGKKLFMSQGEYFTAYNAFNVMVAIASKAGSLRNTGYYTARQRYSDSQRLIEFFEIIISIFLAALVIVALATIVNVLFITLVDRIKIVGTFMAYGMTRKRAILLLSSEMLVFSLAACTVGVIAALLATGPASSLKFNADNWTIAVILGGKRSLTISPSLWAVGATYLTGMLMPFSAAALSASKMLKGEVVRLLHFTK